MDDNIYNDCPKRGNGDPKQSDQLRRRREDRCVYCGMVLPNDRVLLGAACDKQECQDKRWAEFKLTDKQERVFRRNWEAKPEKEISYEMGLSLRSKRLEQIKQAIAKKLWVPCDRVLLARCYGERLDYVNRRNAVNPPKGDTPPKGTPPEAPLQKETPGKGNPPTNTARTERFRHKQE
jgi:hypothetical protein